MKKVLMLIVFAVMISACEKSEDLQRPDGLPENYTKPIRLANGEVRWGTEDMTASDCRTGCRNDDGAGCCPPLDGRDNDE